MEKCFKCKTESKFIVRAALPRITHAIRDYCMICYSNYRLRNGIRPAGSFQRIKKIQPTARETAERFRNIFERRGINARI